MLERLALAVLGLACLNGCSALVTSGRVHPASPAPESGTATPLPLLPPVVGSGSKILLPIAKPTTASGLQTHPTTTTAPTAAPATAAPVSTAPDLFKLPSDVGLRLSAALIDANASAIIADNGAGVISNNGSMLTGAGGIVSTNGSTLTGGNGIVSTNGSTFHLLDDALPSVAASYCRAMVESYSGCVADTNALLAVCGEPANLALLRAGKPVSTPYTDEAGTSGTTTYTLVTGTSSVLSVMLHPADASQAPHQILALTFTDADHGQAVLQTPGSLYAVYTFDHLKNAGSMDGYLRLAAAQASERIHIDVARPASLVSGGPILEVRISSFQRHDTLDTDNDGIGKATALGFADGSLSVIVGSRGYPLDGTTLGFEANPNTTGVNANDFFVDPLGNDVVQPTAANLSNVPPLTDLAADVPEPVPGYDPQTDPRFAFPTAQATPE